MKLLGILCLFVPLCASAAAPAWEIIPAESHLTFTATQNNSPVTGEFKKFTGTINFDPADLATSKVRIVVDVDSMTTSYKDVGETLKMADWFGMKLFPTAVFTANDFIKTGNNAYKANGKLTLRDITLPLSLNFDLDEYSNNKAHAKGSAVLNRTAFGIGKGEWASTKEIKDEVTVNFVLTAMRK